MSDHPSENQATTRWPLRVARAAALLVIVLLAAEGAVRVEEWVRWRTPLLSRVRAVTDLAIRDSRGVHPAPSSTFRKWKINSVGTRGAEPRDGRPRLIVTGASESFGLYESPGHEYPQQLADSLDAIACSADVLNAAFPGMSLPTVEQDLRLRLAELHPTAVLYYPTPPQYLDADGIPYAATPDSSGNRGAQKIPLHSRFLDRAANQLKNMLPPVADYLRAREITASREGHPEDWLFTTVPDDRLQAFEGDLRRLVGTIRSLGAAPILTTHANGFLGTPPKGDDVLRAWERFYPRAAGSTLVAFDAAASERIRRVAADSGVALVDLEVGFRGLPAPVNFADFSHFTDAGAARMASLLVPTARRALGCQ